MLPDLDDTINRLQAFEKAGADVLYAPGLPNIEAVRSVCQAVSKPVNVVMGLPGPSFQNGRINGSWRQTRQCRLCFFKAGIRFCCERCLAASRRKLSTDDQ